jgi:hypothetical protein
MFDSPDSPAIRSVLSLALGVAAAVLAGLYFADTLETGRGFVLVVGMCLAFAAVALGMASVSAPEPGLVFAVLGLGIGVAVIVLGFLAFLLNLAHS